MRKFSFQMAQSFDGPDQAVPFWDEFVARLNSALEPPTPILRELVFARAQVRHARRRASPYRL